MAGSNELLILAPRLRIYLTDDRRVGDVVSGTPAFARYTLRYSPPLLSIASYVEHQS